MISPPMLKPPTISRSEPSRSWMVLRMVASAAFEFSRMDAVRSSKPSRITSRPLRLRALRKG
ncbi:hypothetical protein [Streptomyces sp. NPDC059378]|uniref:hypothetical protein n=1 Tax=Streptomyces sp. NPDC059378 TaxID=3346815 RepID=UPI0036C2647C